MITTITKTLKARPRKGIQLVLPFFVVLSACSAFGPALDNEPLYYLDEYGMVYGVEDYYAWERGNQAPQFNGFEQDYRADAWLRPNLFFGMNGTGFYPRSGFYGTRSGFAQGSYRPHYGGSPGSQAPTTSTPLPADGSVPRAERPVASPAYPSHPASRRAAEIEAISIADRARARRGSSGTNSNPSRHRSEPTATRSPRTRHAPRRVKPAANPPPPSKPRVIDPI